MQVRIELPKLLIWAPLPVPECASRGSMEHTDSKHGFRSGRLQQPVQGSPAQGGAPCACLGTHTAGAREAAVQLQAAVMEGVRAHGYCLCMQHPSPSAESLTPTPP